MSTHQVWVHNLNPFIIQLGSHFGLRWYGMAYMMGFIVGAFIMMFLANRGAKTIAAEKVTDYLTYIVLGVMLGGRIGYVLFYSPDLLTSFKSHLSLTIPGTDIGIVTDHFWSAIAVWEGGMASHGGIIGIILAAMIYARKEKLDWLHLGDLTTLGGGVGIFFGRIANFINGELMGRECSPDLPWAVKFPADIYRWVGYEQDKLMSLKSVSPLLGISADEWTSWVQSLHTNNSSLGRIQSFLDRIIFEIQNSNASVTQAMGEILVPRHPSQLYEALLEGLFLFVVLFWFWRKPRKPGVIGALFLTLYSVVRIFGEQFRMPDAHIMSQEFAQYGITRGQLISSGQFLLAAIFLYWVWNRKVDVISGWGPEAQKLRDSFRKKKK